MPRLLMGATLGALLGLGAACGGRAGDGDPAPTAAAGSLSAGPAGSSGYQAMAGSAGTEVGGSAGSTGSGAGEGQAGTNGSSATLHCGEPGNVLSITSQESYVEHMLGKWAFCSGWHVFGIEYDGLEFDADGSWAFLRDEGGGFVRQKGFDGGGTWSIVDTSEANGRPSYQLNMSTASGVNYIFLAFQEDPQGMRISTMGGNSDYVAY